MTYFVYILYSQKINRFYIGTTDDVQTRLEQHNSKHYPDAFTTKGIPWTLFLSIRCDNSQIAYQLEQFIKKMKSSAFIKRLKEQPHIVEDIINKLTHNKR